MQMKDKDEEIKNLKSKLEETEEVLKACKDSEYYQDVLTSLRGIIKKQKDRIAELEYNRDKDYRSFKKLDAKHESLLKIAKEAGIPVKKWKYWPF